MSGYVTGYVTCKTVSTNEVCDQLFERLKKSPILPAKSDHHAKARSSLNATICDMEKNNQQVNADCIRWMLSYIDVFELRGIQKFELVDEAWLKNPEFPKIQKWLEHVLQGVGYRVTLIKSGNVTSRYIERI